MKYTYHINLDERGEFYADVRDASGTTVWEIREPNDTGYSIFDEGYIRHKNDIAGIERYLIDIKIMTKNDYLVDGDEDVYETSVEDDITPIMRSGGTIMTLPNDTVAQIRESAKMGYTKVVEGMISPKKKGIMLINKKSEVRGTFPLEYKDVIKVIVNETISGEPAMSKSEKLEHLAGRKMREGGYVVVETKEQNHNSETQKFKTGGQMNTNPADWIRSLNVSAFKEDAAKMLQNQILNDPSLDNLQEDDEFFIKFKAYVMTNVPEALKPSTGTGSPAPAPAEPQGTAAPSKQILQTRLKLINLMLKKDKDNKIAKTRKKLIEAALSKMRDGGSVGKKPKMVRTVFEEEEFEYAKGGRIYGSDGFTIMEMREHLQREFPYSFGFRVEKHKPNTRADIDLKPEYKNGLDGLTDADIKSKLFFPQYKKDHAISWKIYQGGENTYFFFYLNDDKLNPYIGTFAFKDLSDVDSSYITRFIAFLMRQYGQPLTKKDLFKDGGNIGGIDMFEDPDNIPQNVQMVLDKYEQSFEDGDYIGLQQAHEELNEIGYTFDYYLDGQAYDLRPIGEMGKVELATKMKDGGRPKSALMRDRKYVNNREKYETNYVRRSTPKNPHYKMSEGGSVPIELNDENGNIVKGFVSDWNESIDKKDVVYGVSYDKDTDGYIVVSGILDGNTITMPTEASDDWFVKETDALKVAHALAFGIDEQEIQ